MADAPRRPRGRPRVAEPGHYVCTFVRDRDFQRFARLARHLDRPMSAVVRDVLLRRLRDREQATP